MPSYNKILLTGPTGYVGGTVLDHLIKSTESSIQKLGIDVLVRREDQQQKLREFYGDRVNPILWKGLADVEFAANIASNYEIIISLATGFILDGAKAFLKGLARRIESGHRPPWFLHVSGCTNLGDRPLTGQTRMEREWDDADGESIYEYLRREDEYAPYPQRTTELAVLTLAEETGVQAVSVNAGCIFGLGTGLFNQRGIIVPIITRYVVQHGYGYKLNETCNYDWVHVEDLADVFILLVRNIIERDDRGIGYIPSGKKGFIFPSAGRALLTEMMQNALDAAFGAGVLPREGTPKGKEIRLVGLQEIAQEVTAGLVQMAEQGWAGRKAQKGTVARKILGWDPKRLDDAWKQDFKDELIALQEGKSGVTMESTVGLK